jgi:hypothetical protein
MAVHKEVHGNELYVYMNGELLYKRWLNMGHGIILSGKSGMSAAQGSFRSSDVFQHVQRNRDEATTKRA